MKFVVACVLALVAMASVAEATHFRYHTASYSRSGRTIQMKIIQAWRLSAYFGSANVVGQTFNTGNYCWGDGQCTNSLVLTATSTSAVDDWVVGETTLSHTYSADGSFDAFYSSCCRISTLRDGNNDNSENIITRVKISSTAPTQSQVATSLPILDFFFLNVESNDKLNVQLDSKNDASTVTVAPTSMSLLTVAQPTGLVVTSNGTISWKPTVKGLYALQLLTTSPSGVIVAVDFIIEVKDAPADKTPPVFTAPVPTTIQYTPGSTVSFVVTATDPDVSDDVTIDPAGMPIGSSLSACAGAAPHVSCSKTFSWPSDPAKTANTVICFIAHDAAGNPSAGQYCVTLVPVVATPCAGGACAAVHTASSGCVQASFTSQSTCASLAFSDQVTGC